MNFAKSNHGAQRRFLEIWRTGRPDLQGDRTEPFERERRGWFDRKPPAGNPNFQAFSSRVQISGF